MGLVLAVWLASRAIVVFVIVTTAITRDVDTDGGSDTSQWLLFRFAHWDSTLYGAVAARGYPPPGETCCYQAFFPGYPWLMRHLAPAFGDNLFAAGLAVTQVSAVAAVLLLHRLTLEVTNNRKAAAWSVVFMAVTPLSVYFSLAYTESLFLALSLAAWLLARHRHWGPAGVAAGLSCTIRINGLFLVAALVVMYLLIERPRPLWRVRPAASTLGLGPLFVLWWMSWLHHRTGLWNAWSVAQEQGWHRSTTWPWVGAANLAHQIGAAPSGHLLLSRVADGVAMLIVVAAPIAFVQLQRWPEATLLITNAIPLVFASIFTSSPRYLLTWFPIYILGGQSAQRWPRRAARAMVASALLMISVCYAWGAQWWIA